MKKGKALLVGLLGLLTCFLIVACGAKKEQAKPYTAYKGLKVYPVTITNIKSKEGDLILKAKTQAPDGAKVLAKSESGADYSINDNVASSDDSDGYTYARVENKKVNFKIDDLFPLVKETKDLNVKDTKLKFKVFAVTGYDEKFDQETLTAALRKAINKAKIKTTTFKVNKELANYYTDLDKDDDSDSNDSDSNDSDDVTFDDDDYKEVASDIQTAIKNDTPVTYDKSKKAIMINTDQSDSDSGMRQIIHEAVDGDTDDWNELTDHLTTMSDSLDGVSIVIVNPDNKNRTLYTAKDGKVTYDFINKK
ncbi:hypothetical protein [Lactobacillus sp. PV034]|uniref:hypothetical protein n=1 Tax=Lactobacillus sp. PV034 TaxID=2594495 RepID=UPI00223F6079|nr:hypothetical protein [Lactobacillus sp. PV034]QNQ81407.1 hypothetical protein FP432_07470 [Lactobacillus sp. PV034]